MEHGVERLIVEDSVKKKKSSVETSKSMIKHLIQWSNNNLTMVNKYFT
jgi:hypothetical protein